MRRFRLLTTVLLLCLVAACTASPEPTQPPATATAKAATLTPTSKAPTATPTPQAPTATPTRPPETAPGPFWWDDVVFYEVFVRSFYDSDGDGVGDLSGLIEKLDYLNDGDPATTDDLGITGIWLMPITQSPSYHGYDVTDYFAVDDEYGAAADFGRLMDEAHERGIRVIVDLVLNHTSYKHPWFKDARSDVSSPYRDFYIWSDEDPGYKSPWGGRVWHRTSTDYYYGLFWEGMPDLNYENPDVTAEMQKAIRFWLDDMGADGFRLDAIKHLIEDGRKQENTPDTHHWLRGFYTFYKGVNADAMTVGEVWSSTLEVVKYIGDQLDLAFEFNTAEAMLKSAKYQNRNHVLRAHRQAWERYPPNQFATFLTNHDQDRAMTQLGNVDWAKSAASLLLTGPGVPFLYYGEEIGHIGGKPDENIRTPMQWSDGDNAGFTTATVAWRAPQRDYRDVNVAAQTDDPDSLLSHYRRLIHARSAHETLRIGDWREVKVKDERIYAFLRHSDDETLLVLINLSDEPVGDYSLSLVKGPLSEGRASEVLTGVSVSAPAVNMDGGFDSYAPLAELAAYSTYIIQLK